MPYQKDKIKKIKTLLTYSPYSDLYTKLKTIIENTQGGTKKLITNKNPNQKKGWAYYSFVALIIILLLNAFIFPSIMNREVTEVDYNTFLSQVDEGKVAEVQLEAAQITFVGEDTDGQETIYITGRIEDPELVDRLYDSDVTFSQEIPTEASPLLAFFLTWVFPILIFWALGSFLSKKLTKKMGGMGGNAMSFGKSNAKVYVKATDGITFDDVAGQEEAKDDLNEIVDFLHNPKKYTSIGANLPKGALLVGPPGTGKTLLAKAVAGEANVPFFSISGSEFVEMFVGMGAAKVRDLFKQANEKAPCIIFIDEIDTIGKKRNSNGMGGNDEREQTLNQLLAEMDGFDGKKGVVLLAATNRPEILDAALLRPGRFDRRVPVELPDLVGREAILKVHAKKYKVDAAIDYHAVALATSGTSGADLANIVNEAALRAVRNERKVISQEDLEESVEVVIAGHQKKNAILSTKEKEIVAYHEIGHALVAAKQTDSAPVHKITIIPRTSGALGYVMQVEEGEKSLLTKEEVYNKIVTMTAGRAAEEIIFGSITTGASNDISQATKLARAMVTQYGFSKNFDMMGIESVNNPYLGDDTSLNAAPGTAEKVDAEVLDIIKSAHLHAGQILSENIKQLHELANHLLVRETITGKEFMDILNK